MKKLYVLLVAVVSVGIAVSSVGCMANPELMDSAAPGDSRISYEYLYGCVWTVADCPVEMSSMPFLLAGRDKAVYFIENSDIMYVLCRKDKAGREAEDGESGDGDGTVGETEPSADEYSIIAECSYSIDYDLNIITVTGEGCNCYLRIDRLNDRSLTVYYQTDRNEYIAYSRSALSSIVVVQ